MKRKNIIYLVVASIIAVFALTYIILSGINTQNKENHNATTTADKPIIYLYPETRTDVMVKLRLNGGHGVLDFSYPDYNSGWNVTAYPDGRLINHTDGKEYSYLFWESHLETTYDFNTGFVVKGTETAVFLQEKLAYMGLMPNEYNEFIVFWLPQMQNNEYNLISFQGKTYTDAAELEIYPAPDSVLRVFMAVKPLDMYIDIDEQLLTTFNRTGFTVVEWGGCLIE